MNYLRYIRLVLDFYHPWANNVGFYYGRDLGYFAEEGIDLDIHPYDPYRGDSLERVLRGEADVAYNYPNRLMMQNEAGAKLLSVAACNSRSFEALIYDTRTDIRGFEDLENRVVGVPRSPRVRAILRYMMEKAGKDPDKVIFREFYPNEPDPLDIARGKIDCVYGSFWGWEGILARLEDEHIAWKEVSELGAPYCHTQIIAVRESLAEESPELVRGFLRATYRGFLAAAKEPEEAAKSMVMVAPYFTPYQFAQAIAGIALTWNLAEWGRHDHELIHRYAQWLGEHGFLKDPTGHANDFTDRFLPETERGESLVQRAE